jgi:mannose-6-phosphate isomerase-like protein (cupin superfamily)
MEEVSINEVVDVWQTYVDGIEDWQKVVNGLTAKDTQCGPVYDVIPNPPEVGDRPDEGFAIADMRGVRVAEPHYHTNGETEIYIVISGLGKTIVKDQAFELEPGTVVVIPPETAHYTLPKENLVLGVVNTPPFNPANVVNLTESNSAVGFDKAQYDQELAGL